MPLLNATLFQREELHSNLWSPITAINRCLCLCVCMCVLNGVLVDIIVIYRVNALPLYEINLNGLIKILTRLEKL